MSMPRKAALLGGTKPIPQVDTGLFEPDVPSVNWVPIGLLTIGEQDAAEFTKSDIAKARHVLRRFGARLPIIASPDYVTLVGQLMLLAMLDMGWSKAPVAIVHGLAPIELEALSVAYNQVGKLGKFNKKKMAKLLLRLEIEMPDLSIEDLALEPAQADLYLRNEDDDREAPPLEGPRVSRLGDLFYLHEHRVLCGNALIEADMVRLMGNLLAAMMFADPPYNVPIDGFVSSGGRHREFAMGVAEMSPSEFIAFLERMISLAVRFSQGGAIHFLCMDWRHIRELQTAAQPHYDELLNLCVWTKDKPGQGSLWRSQHELVFAYRVGKERHRNNVQLGRFGRSRSNVWKYPSASTFILRDESGHLLKGHPTPKPFPLVADAMLDCTVRGDIVLDPFLGSGATLIAAEKVGRLCFGMELDPEYIDLAIRRWQAWTGADAIHEETGLTFNALAALRGEEVSHDG